jgi:hypothetical protein
MSAAYVNRNLSDACFSRRNEAMRLVMRLFDVIDDSPYRQYLKINEADEQGVIR